MRLFYLFILGFFIHSSSIAQSNVFPLNGNVGIGFPNPQSTLHVKGIVKWGDTLNYLYSGQDATGGYLKQVGVGTSTSRIRIQSSVKGDEHNYLQFYIDPEKGYSFNSIGTANCNVGIGTDSPKERLSVNGNIRAHEIKVETEHWPDYVFQKDYKLPTLEETERHIKDSGHLPGIPSASDVKSNGIELGGMNAWLLKKIEELTLYLIDLKKDNLLLNERLKKLENK